MQTSAQNRNSYTYANVYEFVRVHQHYADLKSDRKAVANEITPLLFQLFCSGVIDYVKFSSFLSELQFNMTNIKELTVAMLKDIADIQPLAKAEKNINASDVDGFLTFLASLNPWETQDHILTYIGVEKRIDANIYVDHLKGLIISIFDQQENNHLPEKIFNWFLDYNYNPFEDLEADPETNCEPTDTITGGIAEPTDGDVVENNDEDNSSDIVENNFENNNDGENPFPGANDFGFDFGIGRDWF